MLSLKEQQQLLHSLLGNRYKLARSKSEYKLYNYKDWDRPLAHIYMNKAEVLITQSSSIIYVCQMFMNYIYHYAREHNHLPLYMQNDYLNLYKITLGKWDNYLKEQILIYLRDEIISDINSYNLLLELRNG